jgi:glycosyltransferase involved in cell wall biosynthesis
MGVRSKISYLWANAEIERKARDLFSDDWYRATYLEPSLFEDAWLHFKAVGWRSGYDPSPEFSTNGYLNAYPDVKAAGMNPLMHYVMTGRDEGRVIPSNSICPAIESESKSFDSLSKSVSNRSLNLLFVLPGLGIGGGANVVIEYAEQLARRGHFVAILNVGSESDLDWRSHRGVEIFPSHAHSAHHGKEWDAIIATGWQTVYEIVARQLRGAAYLYFVQAWEPDFYPSKSGEVGLALSTYGFEAWNMVSEAQWLVDRLKAHTRRDVQYVRNGLNDYFRIPADPFELRRSKLRVLLEGPLGVPRKRMDEAFLAVQGLQIELWLVTSGDGELKVWQQPDRMFRSVPIEMMPSIYASCDLMVKLPSIEGMFGPPLEFMAQGGVPITSNVLGHEEYMIDGENGFVVPVGDWIMARERLIQLMEDEKLRERMSLAAVTTAKEFTWDESVIKMEALLSEICLDARVFPDFSELAHPQQVDQYLEMAHGQGASHLVADSAAAARTTCKITLVDEIQISSGWWVGDPVNVTFPRPLESALFDVPMLVYPRIDVNAHFQTDEAVGWFIVHQGDQFESISSDFEMLLNLNEGSVEPGEFPWGVGRVRVEQVAVCQQTQIELSWATDALGWPSLQVTLETISGNPGTVLETWGALLIVEGSPIIAPHNELRISGDGTRVLSFDSGGLLQTRHGGLSAVILHDVGTLAVPAFSWIVP